MITTRPAKAFKPRLYDPARADKRSDAQRAANNRNFAIFRLRGLWAQAGLLAEPYRTGARAAIDADLIARGALPQEAHEREKIAKRLEANAKRQREEDAKRMCPFHPDTHWLECDCIPF